jgi:hypothetical protein
MFPRITDKELRHKLSNQTNHKTSVKFDRFKKYFINLPGKSYLNDPMYQL